MIHWECPNTTLTCAVLQGTDFELKLYQGETLLNSLPQKNMSYQWTNLNAPFKCEAINPVSKESTALQNLSWEASLAKDQK